MPTTVHDLPAADLLTAYIADRLDRVIDRLISIGGRGVAVAGRHEHLTWLNEHVWAMRKMPFNAIVCPDAAACGESTGVMLGAAIVAMNDASWHPRADILLIADDRFQQALYDEALRFVPPKVQITRLYDRLPVGREPMSAMLTAEPTVVTRAAMPRSAETATLGATASV